MTISSAMNTAVSALKAQSQALSVISNNLANTSTTGYKSVTTSFSSLVTQAYSGTSYSGAGVTSASRQNVANQGTISATTNTTDMAIDGNGMFVVSDGGTDTLYYTRNGEFDQDDEGYLTSGNYYLLGWEEGVDHTVSNLTKIDVTKNVSSVSATTEADITANLGPTTSTNQVTSTALATTAVSDLTSLGVDVGDTISITTSDGSTVSYTMTDTDSDGVMSLAEVATSLTGTNITGSVETDSSGKQYLLLSPTSSGATVSAVTDGTGTSASGLALAADTTNVETSTMEVYDSLGTLHTVTLSWAKTDTNQWSVSFASEDGTTSTTSVTLNFNTDGTLDSTSPASPQLNFSWGNGSAASTIPLDFSDVTQTYGDTGVDSASATTDGHSYGKLNSISINEDGVVTANYDNGEAVAIYTIAIGTFPNVDGLTALSNGVYQESGDSGNRVIGTAGENGAGVISASSLESSTVDTADEFTKMIVAQQAYSAASQVITTAKDMYDTLISAVR